MYQPSTNNCLASIALLPQAIPQLTSNPAIFRCETTSFADIPFSPSRILPHRAAFQGQFGANVVRPRRRSQALTCHENSRCANCNTAKTSLWRRNEHGEVECKKFDLPAFPTERPRKYCCTVGVSGGDSSAASKGTRRDRAARAGIPSGTSNYEVFLIVS
ncbi:hypothetical protein Y032_0068g138 [Ancylostoma ceylanicum]|nr:hypothetical protein Y032_0068g138 [Ancylostoma ceylanicum]